MTTSSSSSVSTVFQAGDEGPTVEITENLTLDSPYNYPDNHTVDLAPNATFESNGSTYVTVDSIDGQWTNLTTHNVSAGLTVDPADKQAVTITGENVSTVAFGRVDAQNAGVEFVYSAIDPVTVTITGLPNDTTINAVDAAGNQLDDTTTTADGNGTFVLPTGDDQRVDIRDPSAFRSIYGSSSGGGGSTSDSSDSDGSDEDTTTPTSTPTSTPDDWTTIPANGTETETATPDTGEVTTQSNGTAVTNATSSTPTEQTTTGNSPGFDVVAAGLSVLSTALLARRRYLSRCDRRRPLYSGVCSLRFQFRTQMSSITSHANTAAPAFPEAVVQHATQLCRTADHL